MTALFSEIQVPDSIVNAIQKTMEELELPLSRISAKEVKERLGEEITIGDVAFMLRVYRSQHKTESKGQKLQKLLDHVQLTIACWKLDDSECLEADMATLETLYTDYQNLVGNLVGVGESE